MNRTFTKLLAAALLLAGTPAVAQPSAWHDLVRVSSGRGNAAYLRPYADFSAYSEVMLQPSEIAFETNWIRDFNRGTRTSTRRISDRDARRAIEEWQPRVDRIFAEAFTRSGKAPVTEAGPNALLVRPVIVNLRVSAPENTQAGRSRTFAREAGSATLMLEVRDSLTHQLLGVAVENRVAGDFAAGIPRTSFSNARDFEDLVRAWAATAGRSLAQLQAASPVDNAGRRVR